MKKHIALAILGIFVLASCGNDTIITSDEKKNQIRVVGTANVTHTPDIAKTQIGVQTFDKNVDPAINENNRKTKAVIEALIRQGVQEKDIQTASFTINPRRDYTGQDTWKIVGYQVDNLLSVTFRDLNSIGKALQAAITAGANNINGVTFTLDDPETLLEEARVKAVENARERAKDLAEAAGVTLGDAIYIDDLSQSVPVGDYRSYGKADVANEVPVQPGELHLTVQVQVIFAID